ncbi:hypothetical protein [Nocardia sp. NPDC052566]|uniref:hypothetical protein n=1 Tax=Nocardia sp. NPDC052566 TaxID=3364330 RepID=UPI0037C6562B
MQLTYKADWKRWEGNASKLYIAENYSAAVEINRVSGGYDWSVTKGDSSGPRLLGQHWAPTMTEAEQTAEATILRDFSIYWGATG